MNDSQARGYLLEFVISDVLAENGYIELKNGFVEGRGANHQIDAYGTLSFSTAFIHQIRLLCECKFIKRKIGLPIVRNFVGVIKDVSENYIVKDGLRKSTERYNDCGCIFSATQFTKEAQDYAWAQNIFLVSMTDDEDFKEELNRIEGFINDNSINNFSGKDLCDQYKEIYPTRKFKMNIGILNGNYPIALIGNIDLSEYTRTDIVDARVSGRNSTELETIFTIEIKGSKVKLSIPNTIADELFNNIINEKSMKELFYIDLPYIQNNENGKTIRRMFKINICWDNTDKKKYLKHIRRGGVATMEDFDEKYRTFIYEFNKDSIQDLSEQEIEKIYKFMKKYEQELAKKYIKNHDENIYFKFKCAITKKYIESNKAWWPKNKE